MVFSLMIYFGKLVSDFWELLKMKPLISIIVPVYNVENYLPKCINSLINQDYENIEILLVNDGSTDSSRAICELYSKKDERIKVFNKKNGGLSDARNYGLERSVGEYALFVDSDDYINHNACSSLIKYSDGNTAEVIVGNANIVTNNGIKPMKHSFYGDKKFVSGKEFLLRELRTKTMHVPVWLNLYKKDFLKKNNLFFEQNIIHEDELYTPQVFLSAKKVIVTNIQFYNYVIRENSITTSSNQIRNRDSIVKIVNKLETIYDKTLAKNDNQLKKLLKDHLVDIYINSQLKLPKKNRGPIDFDFLRRNTFSFKNVFRVFLLSINSKYTRQFQ